VHGTPVAERAAVTVRVPDRTAVTARADAVRRRPLSGVVLTPVTRGAVRDAGSGPAGVKPLRVTRRAHPAFGHVRGVLRLGGRARAGALVACRAPALRHVLAGMPLGVA